MATSVPAAGAQPDAAPSGEIGAQIVGGRPAAKLKPGAAALEYNSVIPLRTDHQTCTVVLLENPRKKGFSQWGLTAGHCLAEKPAEVAQAAARFFGAPIWVPVKDRQFHVRAGDVDRTKVPASQIDRAVLNPWFTWFTGAGPAPVDPTMAADFAMFRLQSPVKMQGARIASAQPRTGTAIDLFGWGRTSNDSAATPTVANQLRTWIIPAHKCAGADISVGDFCSNNPGGKKGACYADSGAGGYNARSEVVGLVSRGEAELCGESPDVLTGLATYKPWIDAVMNGTLAFDQPVTPEQGGDPGHPTIQFNTTKKIALPRRVSVS
ncbi:S1 family peptidase [Lentzea sp. NPDC092896]|uniref:S1 family peptidase n=1 Tax=Lentzea sp. NPDC092896 TaxID=3364127 RepID=UPI003814BBB5